MKCIIALNSVHIIIIAQISKYRLLVWPFHISSRYWQKNKGQIYLTTLWDESTPPVISLIAIKRNDCQFLYIMRCVVTDELQCTTAIRQLYMQQSKKRKNGSRLSNCFPTTKRLIVSFVCINRRPSVGGSFWTTDPGLCKELTVLYIPPLITLKICKIIEFLIIFPLKGQNESRERRAIRRIEVEDDATGVESWRIGSWKSTAAIAYCCPATANRKTDGKFNS